MLFVTFYFPPFDAIGCVRTGKTAAYLQKLGHDVRVITARDQGAMSRTLAVELDSSRVTATSWIGPRRFLDTRWNAATSGAPAAKSAMRSAVASAFRGVAYLPDAQAGWIPFAVMAGSRIMRDWRPDAILASSGPASSLIAASILSRRFDVPWVGDLRDLWVDNQNYSYPRWRKPVDAVIQRRVLSSAAGLVTVSGPLADQLREFGPPVEVVLNGYDDVDYEGIIPATGGGDVLRIVYTGTIYPRQDPRPLFEAMAMLGDRARRISVEASIKLHPTVPHRAALEAQVGADVLLHLLWGDGSQPGVYNAKIFEYLRARRPVLAVGNTANITAGLVTERRAGLASADPVAIARQLEQWLDLLDSGDPIPPLPPAVSDGFSREEQTRTLSSFIERVVKKDAAPARASR